MYLINNNMLYRTMREVFSPSLLLTLLEEAQGVPVFFAIMLPTGNVVLEVSIVIIIVIIIYSLYTADVFSNL